MCWVAGYPPCFNDGLIVAETTCALLRIASSLLKCFMKRATFNEEANDCAGRKWLSRIDSL